MIMAVVVAALVMGVGMMTVRAADSAKKGGSLKASGTGRSMVHLMNGTVTISGVGDLWVSEEATVNITGTPGTKTKQAVQRGPRGEGRGGDGPPREGNMGYLYQGFKGHAAVSGSMITVTLLSPRSQTISAMGNGMAVLLGTGDYTATSKNGTVNGSWTPMPDGTRRQMPRPIIFGVMVMPSHGPGGGRMGR